MNYWLPNHLVVRKLIDKMLKLIKLSEWQFRGTWRRNVAFSRISFKKRGNFMVRNFFSHDNFGSFSKKKGHQIEKKHGNFMAFSKKNFFSIETFWFAWRGEFFPAATLSISVRVRPKSNRLTNKWKLEGLKKNTRINYHFLDRRHVVVIKIIMRCQRI